MPWKLTIRSGPKVEHRRFAELGPALDELESRAREFAGAPQRRSVDAKLKRFEPIQQVTARIELAGPQRLIPSVRGGVDVHGDGSTEAYVGRVKREVVEQRKGETPYRALRRVLAGKG